MARRATRRSDCSLYRLGFEITCSHRAQTMLRGPEVSPHFRRKWEAIIRRQSMRGIRARIRCVPGLCDPTTRLGSRQPPELSELSAVMVAHRAGFEPTTPRFVVWCSIQLSYRCCSGPPKLVRPAEIGKHQDWDGTELAFRACRQAHSPPDAVGAVQDGWAALA
jgi:hypothetical protein